MSLPPRRCYLSPWNVLLNKSVWHPWLILDSLTIASGGPFHHRASALQQEGREAEGRPWGQLTTLHNQTPVKTLDTKAQVSFPGCDTLHVLSHTLARRIYHGPGFHNWKRTTGTSLCATPLYPKCLFSWLALLGILLL